MNASTPSLLIDGILDPLSRCLDAESARRLIGFQLDPAVQSRVDILAERANEGLLTDDERAEYETYINMADLIALFKLRAQRTLECNGNS